MRDCIVICDKCRKVILEAGSVLDVGAGSLRRRLGPTSWDLCGECSEGLLSWLAVNPGEGLRGLEPTEAVEPVTVPA